MGDSSRLRRATQPKPPRCLRFSGFRSGQISNSAVNGRVRLGGLKKFAFPIHTLNYQMIYFSVV